LSIARLSVTGFENLPRRPHEVNDVDGGPDAQRGEEKTQVGRPMVKNLCATHVVVVATANCPLCQAKSVRRPWPDLDIEAETTALYGLSIHLLINPDPGFRRQALRMIEAGIDRLRP